MVYPTNFKSLKDRQGKAVEGYLSDQYVFVYLRTQSELLHEVDRFRELRASSYEPGNWDEFCYPFIWEISAQSTGIKSKKHNQNGGT